jgi:hypothetical protein
MEKRTCNIYSGRKEIHVMNRVGKQRGKNTRENRKSYKRER